ncbi:MAG: phage terminase large subunit family protein, partial [Acutalibacter sp.]|nr:phage terminase large subunit family protein [Acutalibacter sp.]
MRRRMPSVRKYLVTGYQHRALQSLLPPEDLNVSQWAEKYRMLDSKTSALPGPWRNSMTPYLVGVMDALGDYETEEIVLCKSAQLGGTEAILNALGYIIQQDPSPTMVVYPSDVLAE